MDPNSKDAKQALEAAGVVHGLSDAHCFQNRPTSPENKNFFEGLNAVVHSPDSDIFFILPYNTIMWYGTTYSNKSWEP